MESQQDGKPALEKAGQCIKSSTKNSDLYPTMPASNHLIILVIFLLRFSASLPAQKIQPGIYTVDSKIDTLLLNSGFKEAQYDAFLYCGAKHATRLYSNLIDTSYRTNYAVVVRAKQEYAGPVYKLILLNQSLSDYSSFVSYSDTLTRKYLSLSLNIDTQNGANAWYPDGRLNEFNSLNYQLTRFAPSDYWARVDKNNNYAVGYDRHTFFSTPTAFCLKSSNVKIFTDSVTYAKQNSYMANDRKSECFYTTEQQAGIFRLQTAKKYLDILPIQKPVLFFTGQDSLRLYPGDFLALTNEKDEWYEGDYINTSGGTTDGRVFIDSLLVGNRKAVQNGKKKFVIFYTPGDATGFTGETGVIHSIKIYNAKGKLVQVLKDPGIFGNDNKLIEFEDVNFDGYKDLVVYSHNGGAGPNFGNNYYLYSAVTGKFYFNEAMSDLSQPSVDTKNKVVSAAWRDGAATHGSEKYKWIKGKLTLVEFYEMTFLDENKIQETHTLRVNGKMKGKTRIIRERKGPLHRK